ncbi:uncharacterized protein ATC70_006863 [Mucor velutinosus]|uniref:C2H2-type domain-containing protein n=1 Tax=Mucor velutinosus TaxID=708070 RepID=A0AAN7DQJ9_9FUNG|nr:hypothetical protein ATC70_006863 [Mucor velutinosus]
MTQQSNKPKQAQAIAFQYPCYICKEIFSTAVDVKSHVICVHYYSLPELASDAGQTRPAEDNLEFKEFPQSKEDAKDLVFHSACPSCWYHCPTQDVIELEIHVIDVHNPISINTAQEQGESSIAAPPQDKEQDRKQETAPTMEDLFEKLDDLSECIRAYLARR